MLIDMEGNCIEISYIENRHIKVIGRAGNGKTYWSCRQIEHFANDIPVIIVDYSGSYMPDELLKSGFSMDLIVKMDNPKLCDVSVFCGRNEEELVENVADAFIIALGISAMMQRRILKEVCEKVVEEKGFITLQWISEKLDKLYEESNDADYKKNADFLMHRLYFIRSIHSLRMVVGEMRFEVGVYIFQLSEFHKTAKEMLSQIYLELMWRTIQRDSEKSVQFVLDEFQNLKLKGTAVEEMLREGRKRGVGMILLSQFVPGGDDVDILEQAATSLYFAPNEKKVIPVAKMIEPQEYQKWIPILKNLEKGSCVLTGRYLINGRQVRSYRPLICRVVSKN